MTTNCLGCGKDIGMDIEFGGNPKLRPVGIDGDGFTCSDACRDVHRANVNRELDIIANPATNLATYLDLPDRFRPYGVFPGGL